MSRETNFQSKALAYLNSLPGCKAENVSGNAKQSGRPDINGCYHGRMFKLELKSLDNQYQASKKQKLELKKWSSTGCVTGVVYSLDVIKFVFSQDWYQEIDWTYHAEEPNNCMSWIHVPGTNRLWKYKDFK